MIGKSGSNTCVLWLWKSNCLGDLAVSLNKKGLFLLKGKSKMDLLFDRSTLILEQIKQKHEIHYPENADFRVDRKYIFEVGGRNKKSTQDKDLPGSYLAVVDIEIGVGSQIPLWLFGFLY